MSEFNYKNIDILSLSLDGFEGPIDLLLSLARDHKIDLTKISILSLAEQYLKFLDQIIKKDFDIAAEYISIEDVIKYFNKLEFINRYQKKHQQIRLFCS